MKIVVWDLECSSLSADFGMIICCGMRDVDKGKTEVYSIRDYPEKDPIRAERLLLKDISKLLLDADVWVAHYGKYFDTVFLNTRLLYHGLPTMPPNFPLIDTWRTSRNQLKLRSNRLVTIQDFLRLKNTKNSILPEQWIRALGGDAKSLRYIEEHCRRDVDVLVDVYHKLKPLMLDHPSKGLFDGRGGCGVCGGKKLQKRGFHVTRTRCYQRWQCQSCGSWSKSAKPTKAEIVST